ncbi:MAG: phage tail protein [Gemmatimonadetes bacterium]|nr:phage tail protein [Gemmatimonadota bacterium]
MSDLLDALLPDDGSRGRIYGVVTALVTNNQDDEGLGRVKLHYPWLSEENESGWAPVAVAMGGKEMGTYFLPEVGDLVLAAFEQGDPDRPLVLGALWSKDVPPPEKNGDGKNNMRTIKSRSGHIVRLDDTDGAEKIEILDKTGKNSVVIDSKANTVTITADKDLTISTEGGKLILKGKGVEITSTADVKIEGSGQVDVKGGSQMNLKAGAININ